MTIILDLDDQMIDDMKLYYGISPFDKSKCKIIGGFQNFKERFEIKYHMTIHDAYLLWKEQNIINLLQKNLKLI